MVAKLKEITPATVIGDRSYAPSGKDSKMILALALLQGGREDRHAKMPDGLRKGVQIQAESVAT